MPEYNICLFEQGSKEWLEFRRSFITATDAVIIMNKSPWKTIRQLYAEKIGILEEPKINAYMQRGMDLELSARELFFIKHGIKVDPAVLTRGFCLASLDGINFETNTIVEIKCPGDKDHKIALSGRIPDHYYPQLQHQMYVANVTSMYYFSFDGFDGVSIVVERDNSYVEKMLEKEKEFYNCLISKTLPEMEDVFFNFIDRTDDEWEKAANDYKSAIEEKRIAEEKETIAKNRLIELSNNENTRGGGVSLCKVERKGAIDYTKIPELKNINLDNYRKKSTQNWRII